MESSGDIIDLLNQVNDQPILPEGNKSTLNNFWGDKNYIVFINILQDTFSQTISHNLSPD